MIDLMALAENRTLPDALVRTGIRKLLRDRLGREVKASHEEQLNALYDFIDMMRVATRPLRY